MERWIGAYTIGLTFPEKLSCPIQKKKKKKLASDAAFFLSLYEWHVKGNNKHLRLLNSLSYHHSVV
jgi:hypothetical protein